MQVGNLSRTRTPGERRDTMPFQAMRVLLVIGLMSAGWLALWLSQGNGPAQHGMVTVTPPETISAGTGAGVAPERAAPVQVAGARPPAPLVPPRPPLAVAPAPDRDSLDEPSDEPAFDAAALDQSRHQSLAVLKQFSAVVRQTPRDRPAPPAPGPAADMNMTGTVAQTQADAPSRPSAGAAASALVDLNKGSVDDLNNLKGAGPLGRAIVRGRPYRSVEDLVTKKVVRRAAYEKIKDQVTVQ